MRTVSTITEELLAKTCGYFLANEINSTGGGIMGQAAHVQIMFPLKDKKMQGI